MISFELTKEQELIKKSAGEFASAEIRNIARDCDESNEIPIKVLDKAWEMGLANFAVPEEYGGIGMGRSALTTVLICEELGYGCVSIASAIMAPTSFIQPLIDFGTQPQKEKYLPLFAGERFVPASMALHEPHFTFDPIDMRTTATKHGDEWILNGIKRLIPFGDRNDYFMVIARTGDRGLSGIDAFILSRDTEGLTIDSDTEKTMGLKPLPFSQLYLEGVVVGDDMRLGGGKGVNGRALINSVRIANSALCTGLSRAVKDYAIPYAKERVAFGEPIAKKQAIAFMLADMHTETECMRWMVWKAADSFDRGNDATKATTLACHYVNKNTVRIADNGVQVFGGHGYIRELPLEMWLRNARTLTVMEGTVSA